MNTQDYIIGCFEAAIAEGLHEAIAETADERLKDLLERRVMHAYYAAKGLGPIMTQEPVAQAEQQEPVSGYGFCPICGAKGIVRERRLNGNDRCAQGHTYSSKSSLDAPPAPQAAAPQPQGEVKLPTSAEEAEAMQKVGYAYLKAHAPHRLTSAALQPDGQKPVAHATVEPLRPDESQRRVTVKWVGQPVAGPLYAAADAVAEQGQGWQPMPDLTALHANGAKAWAGVNAQDLREGKPVGEPPADQLPDAGKMAAALRAIADGTVTGGQSQSHLATVLAYQTLARKTLETDAERMAGARAKWDDTYQGDLLARMENEPK